MNITLKTQKNKKSIIFKPNFSERFLIIPNLFELIFGMRRNKLGEFAL